MTLILLAMLCSVVIGLTLGVFGAGGSILTLPVIHYILGVDAVNATATSLVVVSVTATAGAILNFRKRLVHPKAALALALPAFAAMAAVRTLVIPKLPEAISLAQWVLSRDALILIPYSGVMFAAAAVMIKPRSGDLQTLETSATSGAEKGSPRRSTSASILSGCFIGSLSGFVGAGGGFLIVPALNLFAGLSMPHAVGTSLAIIAFNSGVGTVTDLLSGHQVDWKVTFILASGSLIGMTMGTRIRSHIRPGPLRSAFGIFLAIMALLIIVREIVSL